MSGLTSPGGTMQNRSPRGTMQNSPISVSLVRTMSGPSPGGTMQNRSPGGTMQNSPISVSLVRTIEGSGLPTSSLVPQREQLFMGLPEYADSNSIQRGLLSSSSGERIEKLSSSASGPQEVISALLHLLTNNISVIQKSVLEIQQAQDRSESAMRNLLRAELDTVRSNLAAAEVESRARQEQRRDNAKLHFVESLHNKETQGLPAGTDSSDMQKLLERHNNDLKMLVQEFEGALDTIGYGSSHGQIDAAPGRTDRSASNRGHAEDVPTGGSRSIDAAPRRMRRSVSERSCAEALPAGDPHETPKPVRHQTLQHDHEILKHRLELLETHGTPKIWAAFQEAVEMNDQRCVYKVALDRKLSERSFWHDVLDYFHLGWLVDHKMPDTWSARATQHWMFSATSSILIFCNTCIMGYEADMSIKAALQLRKFPKWLDTCNMVFNLMFAVELILRIVALRTWFWVDPREWGWNMFDFFLVVSSLLADVLNGINLTFARTFRILRAVRATRIIRVLRFFRELRQMLLSILACLGSLTWTFVFLAMIMFMFSILFLQGTANLIDEIGDLADSEEKHARIELTEEWFGSLGSAMFSLLAAVTGGDNWIVIRQPLADAGHLYSIAFVVYLLFVTVGVMNVLTGVFLSSAQEFLDLDLIVQNEQLKVDTFCNHMMQLFKDMDVHHTGEVDWPTFEKALRTNHVRHFLASLRLEPTHVRLIFDLLDEDRSGKINIDEFVMGMVRLKGESKAIDARIIQREIGMIPMLLQHMFKKNVLSNATDE